MRRFLFFVSLFALLSNASWAYDDPAIVVCETQLKNETDQAGRTLVPSAANYERLFATIDQSTVTIRYRVTIATTAPREETFSCLFGLGTKGFVLSGQLGSDECRNISGNKEEIIQFYNRLESVSSPEVKKRMLEERSKLVKERLKLLTQCQHSWDEKRARIEARHKHLTKTGLYPIVPAETTLRDTGLRAKDLLPMNR